MQKFNALVTPMSLVFLSVVGFSKIWPIPPNQMNSFENISFVSLTTGGFVGFYLYVWNVVLLRASAVPAKLESRTVSAAIFGFFFALFYLVLLVLQLAFSSRPGSQYVGIVFLTTIFQFLVIVGWEISQLLIAVRIINRRMRVK